MIKKNFLSTINCISCCSLLALTTIAFANNASLNLPDLGSSANSSFTQEQANTIGDAYIRQARSQLEFVDDPLLLNYLNTLGNHLVNAALPNQSNRQAFTFHLINNPKINAFALPGGHIVIHSGLIHHSNSEQELAGTLAHEIAHITQHHAARSLESSSGNSALAIASILIAAASKNPEAAQAAIIATQGGMLQKRLAYSRQFEKEADNNAIRTLYNAGYNPKALSDFLKILHKTNNSSITPPEFLLTHPLTSSRISEADQRARSYPAPPIKTDSEARFKDFQATIRAEFQLKPSAIISKHKNRRYSLPAHQHLQLALALTKENDFKSAQSHINAALMQDPENLYYLVTDAEISVAQQKYKDANTKFLFIKSSMPSAYPLVAIYHANALIVSKQQNKAIELLKLAKQTNPKDPFIHILLARAYAETNQLLRSFQSRAQYHYLRGHYTYAMKQLDKAIALSTSSFQKRKLNSLKEKYSTEKESIERVLKSK